MSLRQVAAKAAAAAFLAVGDITTTGTLTRTGQSYDATLGTVATTSASYTAATIFTSFANYEVDKITVFAGDSKAILRQASLAVTPLVSDTFTNSAGRVHYIISVMQDPAAATWTLHLRAIA